MMEGDGMDGFTDLPSSQNTVSVTPAAKRRASRSPQYTCTPLIKRPNVGTVASKSTRQKGKQQNIPFPELLLKTFNEPTFIEGFVPVMQSLMCPLIKQAIETTVKASQQALVDLTDSNKQLHDLIKKQMDTIEGQADALKQKDEQIQDLQHKITDLVLDVKEVKKEANDLQQYGRRNSLRFNNVKTSAKNEDGLTAEMIVIINKLIPEAPISAEDIERCHPVGKAEPKQILVKFARYKTKHQVYSAKKNLKNNKARIFMSEDLTKENHSLVKELLQLRKSSKIDSFWTTNGKVFYKMAESSRPILLSTKDELLAAGLS